MKKLLTIILSCLCVCSAHATDPVKQYGQLQVKGAQLCDQQGEPVILRGVSLGWHNLWPRFYNKKVVQTLKQDWNCSVIRAAMGIMIEDNYLENPEFAMQCMTPVIEAAIKQNIYIIIDWHSHLTKTAEAKEFFGRMAQKYGKYPHVIYEIYNEPVEDSWASLKKYATEVIGEIRKYDPDNVVLVGCPHWDQDIHLVADSPLQGFNNVMYTVHFYAATHGDSLRKRTEAAVKKGIPVFISESGATEASGDGKIDPESEEKWIQMCERLGISWVCWSVSDKNESCSMLLPRATATGPWPDDVIKVYGKLVKELLQKYKSEILSTDDLISEGAIGLMKAAEKYDASRGKPFVTFAAPYIRRAIETAIGKLENDINVRSTDESLPIGSRNNFTLLNVLEDKNALQADATVEEITLTDDLLKCLNVLNEREQRVINLYYGNGYERQTMAEIAETMGLKRERVRQVRDTALRKLRKAAKKEEM